MTKRTLLRSENGVELWDMSLPLTATTSFTRYLVTSKRTPEEWRASTLPEAQALFDAELARVMAA